MCETTKIEGKGKIILGKLPSNEEFYKIEDDTLKSLLDYGFMKGNYEKRDKNNLQEIILYQKEKGIILYACFGEQKDIKLYGEICHDDDLSEKQMSLLFTGFTGGSHFKQGDKWHWKYVLNLNACNDIVAHLEEIYANFEICNPWTDEVGPKLMFVTPEENTGDIDKIISKKISSCNPEVKGIIAQYF